MMNAEMIDLHAHILPGLDDGPQDWETAVEMCRIAGRDGIRKLTATPHVKEGVYSSTPAVIADAVAELNRRIAGVVDLQVMTGGDVHFSSDLVTRIKAGEIPMINGKNYLLLELPVNSIPMSFRQTIFELRLAGVHPILTHPERNTAFQGKEDRLREFVEGGAYVQISAMSLMGRFGSPALKSAEALLRAGLCHNIATDAHSTTTRPPILSTAAARAAEIAGERVARMLVADVPAAIIEGRTVDVSDLAPAKRRRFPFGFGSRADTPRP